MSRTKLILLGTGTPNACPDANGPATAIVVDDKSYLIDFGAGVVRQAAKAYRNGIDPLCPKNLTTAFCTHLHSDHTSGYSDLIFTPWVLERNEALQVYGPKGIKDMTYHIQKAYCVDIDFRINGFEKANEIGYTVETHDIFEGIIYQDELVTVEAFSALHGTLECYSLKFTTPDKVIVISGDTAPNPVLIEKAKGCDILLHEVFYAAGLKERLPKWQKYHSEVHTSSHALGEIAKLAKPKLLLTYHRIYHTEVQDNSINIVSHLQNREHAILDEIKSIYDGVVLNGHDMEIYI